MEDVILKEELPKYIDIGDEKLLKIMYAVAKEYIEREDEYELTNEQIQELDRIREMRLSGASKSYSWDNAKKFITGQKKLDEL